MRSRSGPALVLMDDVQFVGDDLGESGFAETRGTIEKDVIEGFTAIARGFESDGDVFFDALLADVFGEGFGADAGVEARVVVPRARRKQCGTVVEIGLSFLVTEIGHEAPIVSVERSTPLA